MRRSSRAIFEPCHALLRAAGRKPPRGSPICCDSGGSRTCSRPPSGLPVQTEAPLWLGRYAQYLEPVCGTAPSTRTAYLRIVTRLLAALFGAGRVQWHTVSAQVLTDFVRQEVATKHGGGGSCPVVPSARCSASWCSVERWRWAWTPRCRLHASGCMPHCLPA